MEAGSIHAELRLMRCMQGVCCGAWPGNIRELRNVVERGENGHACGASAGVRASRSFGDVTPAAKALGLERSHLYKKCQQLGIDLQSLRSSE
jgi:DNA-binding NtrC family response regulator